MNELQVFSNDAFGELRTVETENGILFCGADIARALGYAKPQNAVQTHCKGALKQGILTNGGEQEMLFIPEGDVYRLIVRSKLPAAERFERWVFDEVLPCVRKHGVYATPETAKRLLDDPEFLIETFTALKNEREVRKALQQENAVLQPKAAYYDALAERNTLTNFRETAKMIGVSERTMICRLLEDGYLYRDQRGRIQPYANSNKGYFEIKECRNVRNGWGGTQVLVTMKGRHQILAMFGSSCAGQAV